MASKEELFEKLKNGVVEYQEEEVKEAIRRLAGKNDDNFYDAGKMKAALAKQEGRDLAFYSYNDLGMQAEAMLASISQLQMMSQMMMLYNLPNLNLNAWVDFNAMPQAETLRKYLGRIEGSAYRTADGIVSESAAPHNLGRVE